MGGRWGGKEGGMGRRKREVGGRERGMAGVGGFLGGGGGRGPPLRLWDFPAVFWRAGAGIEAAAGAAAGGATGAAPGAAAGAATVLTGAATVLTGTATVLTGGTGVAVVSLATGRRGLDMGW